MEKDDNHFDQTDYVILDILQKQGRLSYRNIGNMVALSAPSVAERIHKMEQNGVIEGYKAIIDYKKIGFHISAIISMSPTRGPGTTIGKSLRQIMEISEVIQGWRMTGQTDLYLHVIARDVAHLDKILSKLSRFGKTSTTIALEAICKQAVSFAADE